MKKPNATEEKAFASGVLAAPNARPELVVMSWLIEAYHAGDFERAHRLARIADAILPRVQRHAADRLAKTLPVRAFARSA